MIENGSKTDVFESFFIKIIPSIVFLYHICYILNMNFKFFPDNELHSPDKDYKDEVGDVGREIKDLSRYRPDLYLRVKTFLTNLAKVDDISPYLQNQQIYKFPDKGGLYEMRIPKQAGGGVFRIYFCFAELLKNTLILLCAELKHKTKPMKLNNAEDKLKQYKEMVKQGDMQ